MQVVQGLRNCKCRPYKWEIGDIVSRGERSKFKVLDRRVNKDKTRGYKFKEYYCECMNCGQKQWYSEKYFKESIKKGPGNGCRNCGNVGKKNYIDYENCIANKAQWMIPFLANSDDAYKYTTKSKRKISFKCPQCGSITENTPGNIFHAGHMVCPQCSDYFSFPNKFGLSMLRQCNAENLKNEYSQPWSNGYKYDFYFTKSGQNYIVEFDGGFHFNVAFGLTPEEKQAIDRKKNKRWLRVVVVKLYEFLLLNLPLII